MGITPFDNGGNLNQPQNCIEHEHRPIFVCMLQRPCDTVKRCDADCITVNRLVRDTVAYSPHVIGYLEGNILGS